MQSDSSALEQFLTNLHLEEYIPAFNSEAITLQLLLNYTKDDLVELGVNKKGHRDTILQAIQLMNSNQEDELPVVDLDTSTENAFVYGFHKNKNYDWLITKNDEPHFYVKSRSLTALAGEGIRIYDVTTEEKLLHIEERAALDYKYTFHLPGGGLSKIGKRLAVCKQIELGVSKKNFRVTSKSEEVPDFGFNKGIFFDANENEFGTYQKVSAEGGKGWIVTLVNDDIELYAIAGLLCLTKVHWSGM